MRDVVVAIVFDSVRLGLVPSLALTLASSRQTGAMLLLLLVVEIWGWPPLSIFPSSIPFVCL